MRARYGVNAVAIGRDLFSDPKQLQAAVSGADAVVHMAGVNRAQDPTLLQQNVDLAVQLTGSLDRAGSRPLVLYANSIQSGNASPFGQAKEQAADHLRAWGLSSGATVVDVRLPNLFGEHGRPRYNSVVATFCDTLARGDDPEIIDDRTIPLLHVQDALAEMLDLIDEGEAGVVHLDGELMAVSALKERLRGFHDLYATGDIPNLANRFDRALFNTYRSFCFPHRFPFYPEIRSDERGDLFECVRARGGECQLFCSSTRPGVTRGNHFHLRKVERFTVLRGSAVIALRRFGHREVVRFEVSGDRPSAVDMPTMWAHSITNTGQSELVTLFWTDEVFDRTHPDTHPEPVETIGAPA